MIRIYESVNESVPEWIRSSRDYSEFLSEANRKGIDLYNATFVTIDPPTSNRDPILKDPTKIVVFGVDDFGGIRLCGLGMYPYLTSQRTYSDRLSWKALLSITKYCGYYDLTSNVKKDPELLNARKSAKQGDINYNRDQRKQYKYKDHWLTKSDRVHDYDKSGYAIPTPTELLGKLYNPAESSWDQVLNNIYKGIKKIDQSVKSKVSQIDEFSKEAVDIQRDYYSRLSTVLYYYEQLADSIARYDGIVAKDDGSDKSKLTIDRFDHYCSNQKSILLTNITYLRDEAKRLDQLIK